MCCAISSVRWAVLGALALAGGCAPLEMELPQGFLQLETGHEELKATTPDEARLWVREFDDRDQGDLSFWSSTLQNDLERRRGYRLVRVDDTEDAAGRAGVVMELAATVEGEPQGYLIAIFVIAGGSTNTIRVVEFVARDAVFAEHAGAVRAALRTLGP